MTVPGPRRWAGCIDGCGKPPDRTDVCRERRFPASFCCPVPSDYPRRWPLGGCAGQTVLGLVRCNVEAEPDQASGVSRVVESPRRPAVVIDGDAAHSGVRAI